MFASAVQLQPKWYCSQNDHLSNLAIWGKVGQGEVALQYCHLGE